MSEQNQDLVDEIKLAVDASGVETGVGRAKRSIEDLGNTVENVGKRGGEGLNRMGRDGAEAGQKLDQVTRNMVSSLQRQIAAAEAGGTATRQYQESIARLRGANMDVLRPYLDQLDTATAKTKEAERAVDSMSGTMRSLGNYLGGMAGGFAAYFSLRTFIDETIAAEQEQAQLAAVLRSTGEAAGWSREQLNEMAEAMSSKGGKSLFSAGEITQAQTRMLSYSNVVGDVFPRAMQNAIDMAQRMGMDVKSASETVGKALDVPSEGLTALQRQGFRFSESQKDLVEHLEATGRTAEAQGIILAALESSYGGAAEAARNTFGGSLSALKNTINDLMTGEGGSVDSMRKGIEDLNGALGSPQTKEAFQNFLGWIATVSANAVTGAANLLAFVQASDKLAIVAGTDQYGKLKSQAEAYSHQLEQLTARAERYQEAIDRRDNVAQNQRNLDRTLESIARVQRQAMDASQALKDFAGQAAGTVTAAPTAPKPSTPQGGGSASTKKAAEELRKELAEQAKLIAELNGLSSSFQSDWERLNRMYAAGKLNVEQLTQAQADLLAKQPGIKAAIAEETKAREAALKNAQQLADARNRENDGIEAWMRAQQAAAQQSLQSVQSRVQSLHDEEKALEIAATLNISLAEAVERVALARLEEKQSGFYEGSEGWLAIQKEIDARRELLGLIGSKEAREANKRAADEAAKDWERTAQTISDTLADYIMGGGRDAAQYLKRLFATLVLQPTVQALVGSVLGTGPAAAASTGSSIMGLANNASSLNTLYGTASQALVGGTAGASMASLGYANAVGMLGGDAIGALATANGMWAGVATGAQAAAQAAVAANTAMAAGTATALEAGTLATAAGAGAGAGAGITSALAAIPGWGLALAGVLALGAIFGGNKSTPHMGGAGSYSAEGGASTGLDVLGQGLTFGVGERYYDKQAEQSAVGVSQGIVQLLDSTATAFGQKAGYYAATAFADDSSKDGAWGSLIIRRDGEKVLDWADTQTSKWAPREFSDGESGQKEYAAAIAASARDALKTAVGDADWAKDMLDQLGDQVTLEGLSGVVAQINQAQAALATFGQYMPVFGTLAESAVNALVNASGGVAPLQANMAAFVDQFYSESEKLAINTENVRKALQDLGFEMPETRDEFKALVQAQLALGDAGAKTAAGLLGLSGAFASVTPAAESAQSSIASVSDQLRDAFGMTAEAVSGILSDAVKNAETASEAQRMASQAFEDKFYGGALDNLTDSLGAMIQSSVIAPMMESLIAGSAASASLLASGGAVAAGAMASGGAAGGAASAAGGSSAAGAMASGGASAANAMVSGGSAAGAIVASAVEQARAQVNAYTQILSDPDVQAGIKDISKLMGDVAGMTFAAKSSWGGGGYSAASFNASGAGSEADKLAQSLKNLGEAVEDEIKRLRGINTLDSDAAQATLLAQFATATAAARAGDMNAFSGLTDLSKSIEKVTAESAVTNIETVRMRAWLANSLEETMKALGLSVPAFAEGGLHSGGLRLVGERGWEVEATGPARYWNQQQLGSALGGGNAELLAEVRALRAKVEELTDSAYRTARNTDGLPQMVDQFDNVTEGGDALRNKEVK